MPIAIMVVYPVTRVQGSRLPPTRRDVNYSEIDPLRQQKFCGALLSRRSVFRLMKVGGAYAPPLPNFQTGMPSFLALSARFS